MADLRSYELKHVMGLATDTASRTSRSGTKYLVPMDPGGNQLNGDATVTDVPTEHGAKGVVYRSITERNSAGGTISHPLLPSNADHLAAAVKLSSAGLPRYYQISTAGFANLGVTVSGNTSPLVSRDRIGCICTGFSLSIDRENPAPITLSTNWLLNAERDNAAASTTSGSNVSAGTARNFVLASAASFNVGDYVTIVDSANGTTETATQITAITSNTITVASTSVTLNGSSTPLTVTKAFPGTSAIPALGPYRTSDVFVDFIVANSSGVFGSYSGDNEDVSSLDLTYDGALTPRTFTSNASDTALDGVWTRVVDGIATLSGTVTLTLSEDAYLTYRPENYIRKCRLRIMGSSPSANADSTMATATTTSTDNETAGANKVFTLASATGFEIGDLVTMTDGTNTQSAVRITAKSGSNITVSTSVALNGSVTPITVTKVGTDAVSGAIIRVASATGFAVGDVILLDDGDNQSVATITAIAGTNLTVDALTTAIDVGATVRNTAWQILVPTADITAAPLTPGDENYTVAISFNASVDVTTGSLLTVTSYNDDNA